MVNGATAPDITLVTGVADTHDRRSHLKFTEVDKLAIFLHTDCTSSLLRRRALLTQQLSGVANQLRAVSQLPRLNESCRAVDKIEEVQIADVDIHRTLLFVGARLDMGASRRSFLFDSAAIFHDDAPRIIPGLSIGSNRRALDRELCHRTQPMLVRLTEDLILCEIEAIQIVLHSAENEGEKSRERFAVTRTVLSPVPLE